MPVSRREHWVRIAELDDHDQIKFTPEFQAIMGDLGWGAKAFVGHLLGLWYDPFEHMLDYGSGEGASSRDQPGHFHRNGLDEPQGVVEFLAVGQRAILSGSASLATRPPPPPPSPHPEPTSFD